MHKVSADLRRLAPWAMALLLAALWASLWSLLGLRETSVAEAQSTTQSAAAPNILLLIADDLGYGDSHVFSDRGLQTPALASLAQDGVRFTRHYADSTCTPSRVALYTGRDAERSGFRSTGSEIPPEFPTLPQRLREAGYQTHLVGKWHAGEARSASLPLAKGFDSFFGFHNQWELSGQTPGPGSRPTYHQPWLRDGLNAPREFQGHLTDVLAEHSEGLIRDLAGQPQPWLLVHAFFAPHAPVQPAPRYAKDYPDTPRGRYEAMVKQLDDTVASLLRALDETAQSDNTIVVFVSDNGGTNVARNNNHPFAGRKGETGEGALRTPLLIRAVNRLPQNRAVDAVVMNTDIMPTVLAMAGLPLPAGLDGANLLPLIETGSAAPRARSWESYLWNIDALTYSYLSADGRWRLANAYGMAPQLFDLEVDPTGATDVAPQNLQRLAELQQAFWASHGHKARFKPAEEFSAGVRRYRGFDLMRTPSRQGFAIGLALGPAGINDWQSAVPLAGQRGVWSLQYAGSQRLRLEFAGRELQAQGLRMNDCNRIVITGHLQAAALVSAVAANYQLRLYLNGVLADSAVWQTPAPVIAEAAFAIPTAVALGGYAVFANQALSAAADSYLPSLIPDEHRQTFVEARASGALQRPELGLLDDALCRP